jgi:RimJ/RimL family protein N-acetyltransferase
MELVEIFPVFGLRVRTPRLTLRPVDPDLAYRVADLAASGIHDPATMPFLVPWTRVEPPELQRNSARHFFERMARLRPESWQLPLAVFEGDELVGIQAMEASNFAVLRQFGTGSWLARRFQGRGIGREMRAAVLHLGFAGLGAERAVTDAFADNPASLAVTRSLGYRPNGSFLVVREGRPVEQLKFLLERSAWAANRRDDIAVEGLDEDVRAFLGAA